MASIQLTPYTLSQFQVTKSFKRPKNFTHSIGFDDTGDFCAISTNGDHLDVFDCRQGILKASIPNIKYGVSLARFTHSPHNLIQASTKTDNKIRYYSLHDNKFIRFFEGHEHKVHNLVMSPLDDQFISASFDNTIRLWDLRSPQSHGMLDAGRKAIATIDNAGLVFAVGIYPDIRLYDIRSFDTGPFSTWNVADDQIPTKGHHHWTSIKFTNDGQYILLTTSSHIHYLIHAFEGIIVKRLLSAAGKPKARRHKLGQDVTLTPDGRFAIGATFNGDITCWDLLETETTVRQDIVESYEQPLLESHLTNCFPTGELSCGHQTDSPIVAPAVEFHPNAALLVSATPGVVNFWQPPSTNV
ncbi:WD40-repeat-containing domain protein [Chlamydoabsidia padenii]|nr:WD40-repeat-containing domain protein [Chlamydoabsidia padenii]